MRLGIITIILFVMVLIPVTISDAYGSLSLDKGNYSWTDKVKIRLMVHGFDHKQDTIQISVGNNELKSYKLSKAGNGLYTGEVILTGFLHDVDGDGKPDTNPRTTGSGPNNGFLESARDEKLEILVNLNDGTKIKTTTKIAWNVGEISFDLPKPQLDETAKLQVIDPDMNLNPETLDKLPIHVFSDSDKAGILVDAIETEEESGIFETTVSFSQNSSSSGNRLFTMPEDAIYAQYTDYTLPEPYHIHDDLDIVAESRVHDSLIPEPEQDKPIYENCGLGTTLQDGICVVKEQTPQSNSTGIWGPVIEIPGENLCLDYRGAEVDENCNIIRPSPFSQQQNGIEPEKVKCNHDLYRSYKTSDGTAFCASGYAMRELIHRGYAQGFDSITSATVSGSNNVVNEYCPASQELIQWGWYAYKNPTDIVVTNIDLVYSAEEDSNGVEFTFEKPTEGKSMLWVFVECDDHFDTFEVIILPETIEHRKNFVVYYPDNPNTTFRFVNQDTIPYKIDGISDNGKNSFSIWIDPQDDWIIDEPPSSYEGVNSFALSAANPDTEELYEWMNYIIYISENR